MRPKLTVPLLLLLLGAAAALCLPLLLTRATPITGPSANSLATAPAQNAPGTDSNQERAEAPAGQPALEAGTPETYTDRRIEELRALGMTGETNSLGIILSELTSRDPAIRRAAVDAAVQFGSRDAIPALADASGQTDDPEEKVALQKAIDFLKLPALGELHAGASPQP